MFYYVLFISYIILYWFKVFYWVRGNEFVVMISFRYYFMVMFGLGSSIGIFFEGVIVDVLVVIFFDDFKVKVSKVCMVEGGYLFVFVYLDESMIFRILFFFFYLRYYMIYMRNLLWLSVRFEEIFFIELYCYFVYILVWIIYCLKYKYD